MAKHHLVEYIMHAGNSPSGVLHLNISVLRPGDVLLTRSSAKHFTMISLATKGPFSHSAIVVNSTSIFEADRIGSGYTPLSPDRCEIVGTEVRQLHRLPQVKCALVLRHPKLAEVHDLESLSNNLMTILYPFMGLEYSALRKLTEAWNRDPILKGFASRILGIIDNFGDRKFVPGPFCSELVSLLFEQMRLQCFKKQREPKTINPNTFLESILVPVKDAIRYADPDCYNDKNLVKELREIMTFSRNELTGNLVQSRRSIAA